MSAPRKADFIKNKVAALNFSQPLRLPVKQPEMASIAVDAIIAPEALPKEEKAIVEQGLSKKDSLQFAQCAEKTVAKIDSIQNEPCVENKSAVTTPAFAMLEVQDSGQNRQCAKRTVSKLNPVLSDEFLPVKNNFTQVPNVLLRATGQFSDPTDFMIYLHLFSYSHGFGRKTADMSQSQLEQFTGISKNAVKRSLDRLQKSGWIKIEQEFERSRVSRRWLVRVPKEVTGPSAGPPEHQTTGFKTDPVQNGQCSKQPITGFKTDSVTGSKMDTYKERSQIPFQINSLSQENLREYFEKPMPQRKRESEWGALLELKDDFTEAQIADCLARVQERGTLTGEHCHSPMAYLARAMGEVWGQVEAECEEQHRKRVAQEQNQQEQQRQQAQAAAEAECARVRERQFAEFVAAQGRAEAEIVAEICRKHGFFATTGQLGRQFAIAHC